VGKCPESQKYIESCEKMLKISDIHSILWENVQNLSNTLNHGILCISEILSIFPQDYMYFRDFEHFLTGFCVFLRFWTFFHMILYISEILNIFPISLCIYIVLWFISFFTLLSSCLKLLNHFEENSLEMFH
jgi:hypothetical protein